MFDDVLDRKQFFMFQVRERNLYFLLGVLSIIGCPVQLISEALWDCICVDTHLPHFQALTDAVIHVFSSFIFQTLPRSAYSLFIFNSVHLSKVCQGLLFLSSRSIHLLKVCWIFVKRTYFMSLLKVCYQSVFVESLKFLFWIKRLYFSAISLENMCNS